MSPGEERRSSQEDLLPLPLPDYVMNAVFDRARLIGVAMEKPKARGTDHGDG